MREVAERAGCSRVTVSKALRNAPDISPARREEIRKIADEMGYRPNPLVSALMASRASKGGVEVSGGTLALVTNWPTPDQDTADWRSFPNIIEQLEGIHAQAARLGFRVEEFSLASGGYSAARLHKVLTARGVTGIILPPAPDYGEILKIPFGHFVVGAIGGVEPLRIFPRVSSNRFDNMVVALRRLEELGYRRPGFALTSGQDEVTNFQYHGGYLAHTDTSTRMRGLPVHVLDEAKPHPSFASWLEKHRPDVLVGDVTLLPLLKEAGFSVPERIAFAALGSKPEQPGIAGFDSNLRETGVAVVDLVTAQMFRNEYGLPKLPRTVLINGTWIDGPSAPPRRCNVTRKGNP